MMTSAALARPPITPGDLAGSYGPRTLELVTPGFDAAQRMAATAVVATQTAADPFARYTVGQWGLGIVAGLVGLWALREFVL